MTSYIPFYYFNPLLTLIFCIQFLGVFGKNKIIIFGMDEKGGNECILNVFDRIQCLDIKIVLNKPEVTFYLMVDLTNESAIPLKTANFPPCLSANSFDSVSKLEKGESRTRHPI